MNDPAPLRNYQHRTIVIRSANYRWTLNPVNSVQLACKEVAGITVKYCFERKSNPNDLIMK